MKLFTKIKALFQKPINEDFLERNFVYGYDPETEFYKDEFPEIPIRKRWFIYFMPDRYIIYDYYKQIIHIHNKDVSLSKICITVNEMKEAIKFTNFDKIIKLN